MSTQKFDNFYNLENEKILGRGKFGIVKACTNKWTNEKFAVKILTSTRAWEDGKHEKKILNKLKHEHIVELLKTFEEKVENKEVMYLVLELVSGGELYKDITGRKTYTEADASHAIKQILKAIEFCHSKKIVHSDLKPQNILLKSKKEEAPIKIVDFGLAFEVIGDKLAWHGGGGTVTHLPPEVVNKQPYGKPIDIWACGVILYTLLVGNPPFQHTDESQLKELIKKATYTYPPEIDATITAPAKELIKQMLCVDSNNRLTATDALKHTWFADTKRLALKPLHLRETVANLKKFNAQRKLKDGVLGSIAADSSIKESPSEKAGSINSRVSRGSISTVRGINNTIMDQERRQKEIIKISIKLIKACNIGDYKTIRKLCDPHVRDTLVDLKDKMEKRKLSLAYTACRSCVKVDTVMLHPYVYLCCDSSACITYFLLNKYYCQIGYVHPHLEEVTKLWHKRFGKWKLVHIHCSDADLEF